MNHVDAEDVGGAETTPSKGLIAYFAANPVAANLLMVFLVVAGVIVGSQLAIQNWPTYDLRRVTVTVPSPGASPAEIQEDINRRVEEAVIGIAGVNRVVSSAKDNFGRIVVEFETFADKKAVLDEVVNAVDSLENFPPLNAERPEIKLDQQEISVLTIAVSSELETESDLRRAAEELQDSLLALPGVSHVGLSGVRDREISIELNEETLRRHRINLETIAQAIQQSSLNLTFGELRTGAGKITMQSVAKRHTGDEFMSIPVITEPDGSELVLGDLATIRDDFVDDQILTEVDGVPTVFVQVDASENQSVRKISVIVKDFLETHISPENISVSVWDDDLAITIERFSRIFKNAVIGITLVFLSLVAVFDLRNAFWISFGIPLSFVGSLLFFGPADLTLNMGTMFAFFLMIGIVVDDAVVVGESILAERGMGKPASAAAASGARVVFGPLFVGAVTTVLALLPLIFINSGVWQLIKVIPYVAMFVLVISLLEAFLILPAHLSHERPWSASPLSDLQRYVRQWFDRIRDSLVSSAVSWSVRNVWLSISASALVIITAILFLRFEVVPVVLADARIGVGDAVQAEVRLPVGSTLETTLAAAERFSEAAARINDDLDGSSIRSITVVAGTILSTRPDEDDVHGDNIATVKAYLHSRPTRSADSLEIERVWRQNVGNVSDLEGLDFVTTQVKLQPNFAYSIRHDDLHVLQQAATELQSAMSSMPGVYDIYDNLSPGKRQLELELTPAGKAAGLTTASIGSQLRARLHGIEAQRIQRFREEIKVVVNYPQERRRSLSELAQMRLNKPGGGQIPLSVAAKLTETQDLAELTRIDGQPAVFVEARVDSAIVTPNRARRQIEEGTIAALQSRYPDIIIERDGGAREENETLETLATLVPLSLLAIYAVMAGFLRSYWKPMVVATGIPAAFAGSVLIHLVLGWNFTFMSIFGILAASGVAVNDGLVLLDRYGIIRREKPKIPAIAVAAAATRQRFRAVFLTSLTTGLGLLPLIYERSEALLFLVPFAASMLGGLILSGLFTLFFLPAMIMIAEGQKEQ